MRLKVGALALAILFALAAPVMAQTNPGVLGAGQIVGNYGANPDVGAAVNPTPSGSACPAWLTTYAIFANTSGAPTSIPVSIFDGAQCVSLGVLNATAHTFAFSGSSGAGTVTSVAATVPAALLAISGTPITGTGTLAFSLVTQTANCVFAGPTSGGAATPTCRALVAADLPASAAFLNVADQTLSGGANLTPYNPAAGNYTIDCGQNPVQYIFNAGAFTLTAPVHDGHCVVEVINASGSGSAPGAVSLANFSPKSPGGATFAIAPTQSAVAVSVTSASPAVITWTAHGLGANSPVYFTAGAMPTGLSANQVYYVVPASITTNTFQVASTPDGAALNTSSTGTSVLGNEPSVYDLGVTRDHGLSLGIWAQVQ